MDSLLSFSVGLFHPLQHAGLSRRSPGSPLTTTCTIYWAKIIHAVCHLPPSGALSNNDIVGPLGVRQIT